MTDHSVSYARIFASVVLQRCGPIKNGGSTLDILLRLNCQDISPSLQQVLDQNPPPHQHLDCYTPGAVSSMVTRGELRLLRRRFGEILFEDGLWLVGSIDLGQALSRIWDYEADMKKLGVEIYPYDPNNISDQSISQLTPQVRVYQPNGSWSIG
ncbi:hypothetical protein J4457_02705 [Candidatus Woesearchaeota archaeon]|nr:hypothetical protein [Candidatus Woesearchaeota archaeon]